MAQAYAGLLAHAFHPNCGVKNDLRCAAVWFGFQDVNELILTGKNVY